MFGLTGTDNNQIIELDNVHAFMDAVRSKSSNFMSLYDQYREKGDYMLLELEYTEPFNPLYINYNDFEMLQLPLSFPSITPYTHETVRQILNDLATGQCHPSVCPAPLMQAHLPYITRKTIINYYFM